MFNLNSIYFSFKYKVSFGESSYQILIKFDFRAHIFLNYFSHMTVDDVINQFYKRELIFKWIFCLFFFADTGTTSATSDDEENEFYDAQEEGGSITSQVEDSSFILKIPMASNRRNSNDANGSSSEGEEPNSETQQVIKLILFKI